MSAKKVGNPKLLLFRIDINYEIIISIVIQITIICISLLSK